ncbi:hypothetical protein [Simkania sp.]|uniref:hypothetical protein n=1 Tax=Simkania sp. TaxID=34094 RepID=UPI003B522388
MANAIGGAVVAPLREEDFCMMFLEENEEQVVKEKACEVEIGVGTKTKVFMPKRSGKQERQVGYGTQLTSYINSRTIVKGADRAWDRNRLIEGKYKQFQRIGGDPLTLTTQTGDQISAFHFEVDSFYREVDKMGGKFVDLELNMNHPFFENAQPVELSLQQKMSSQSGVRIPYTSDLESEFKNPKDFLAFCKC